MYSNTIFYQECSTVILSDTHNKLMKKEFGLMQLVAFEKKWSNNKSYYIWAHVSCSCLSCIYESIIMLLMMVLQSSTPSTINKVIKSLLSNSTIQKYNHVSYHSQIFNLCVFVIQPTKRGLCWYYFTTSTMILHVFIVFKVYRILKSMKLFRNSVKRKEEWTADHKPNK